MSKGPSPVKKPAVVPSKHSQQKKQEYQEKPFKPKAKGGRPRGRISTPERKPARKEPVCIPREEFKKKKGSCYFVFHFVFHLLSQFWLLYNSRSGSGLFNFIFYCCLASVSLLLVVSLSMALFFSDHVAVIRKTELTKKMETHIQSPSKRTLMKPAVRETRPTHHSCPRRRHTGDTIPWSVAQLVLSALQDTHHKFSLHVNSTVTFILFFLAFVLFYLLKQFVFVFALK